MATQAYGNFGFDQFNGTTSNQTLTLVSHDPPANEYLRLTYWKQAVPATLDITTPNGTAVFGLAGALPVSLVYNPDPGGGTKPPSLTATFTYTRITRLR